jgi:hypothetical protein
VFPHGFYEELDFVADELNNYGIPCVGSQTRPKNVAVYYYIKIK